MLTPEQRAKEAWSRVRFGPGWEQRLSDLIAEEIREAVEAECATLRAELERMTTERDVLREVIDRCGGWLRIWLRYRQAGVDAGGEGES